MNVTKSRCEQFLNHRKHDFSTTPLTVRVDWRRASEHLHFIPMGVELHTCAEKTLITAKSSEMFNFMQIASEKCQVAASPCEKQIWHLSRVFEICWLLIYTLDVFGHVFHWLAFKCLNVKWNDTIFTLGIRKKSLHFSNLIAMVIIIPVSCKKHINVLVFTHIHIVWSVLDTCCYSFLIKLKLISNCFSEMHSWM